MVVTVGQADDPTIDFAFVPEPVRIGNYVWIEDDADGDATTGNTMPMTNTIVTATAADGTVYTTTTDANGQYTLTVPAYATYTVTVSMPTGHTPSGTLISSDNDPSSADNMSHDGSGTVVSVTNVDNHTIDFGFSQESEAYAMVILSGLIQRQARVASLIQTALTQPTDTLVDGLTVTLYRVISGSMEATPFITTTTDEWRISVHWATGG